MVTGFDGLIIAVETGVVRGRGSEDCVGEF